LSQIEEVIKVYQARFGIEALFKDCKGWEFCQGWVEQLMQLERNKLPYFQRGLRAIEEMLN
jgi:hypothetical protein